MKEFWKQSPEWQRAEELEARFDAATKAMGEAGEQVLYCVAADADSSHGDFWRERRQAYKDAVERCDEAYAAWRTAHEAFKASPAGRAFYRFLKDPLAPAEQEAA